MQRQRGGATMGEGGYGKVMSMEDLPPDPAFVVEYVDLTERRRPKLMVSLPIDRTSLVSGLIETAVFKQALSHSEDGRASNSQASTQEARNEPGAVEEVAGNMSVVMRGFANGWGADRLARCIPLAYMQGEKRMLLSLQPDGGGPKYALYRSMHGDLVTFGRSYGTRLGHVLDAARAVMRSIQLLAAQGAHHCDIKPENVLFRVMGARLRGGAAAVVNRATHAALAALVDRGAAAPEFVASDYGSARTRPADGRVAFTNGFLSPVMYDAQPTPKDPRDQRARYEGHVRSIAHRLAWPGRDLGDSTPAGGVWDSYRGTRESHSWPERHTKNDLYALGVTLLHFVYPETGSAGGNAGAAGSRVREEMHRVAMALVSGDRAQGAIWTVAEASKALSAAAAKLASARATPTPYVRTAQAGQYKNEAAAEHWGRYVELVPRGALDGVTTGVAAAAPPAQQARRPTSQAQKVTRRPRTTSRRS